jgi:hypothetical protein
MYRGAISLRVNAAWKFYSTFLVSLLLLLVFSNVPAQNRQSPVVTPAGADKASPNDEEQHAPGSIEEEMRAKRAIKFAEAEHKETLERARELSELAAKLRSSFQHKNSLDKDDDKRLDRLEKLTKQLRSRAGGSSIEIKIEKPPSDLEGAVDLVANASESLSNLVQKTPRRVISTAVIDEANVLLQLIDLVRQFSHRVPS